MIKVLVVDDSALMRKIISDMINDDSQFEVIGTARDGADAIQKVRKLKPDVMTLDLFMPKLDGIEVIQRLMKNNPLPILVISAYSKENAYHTVLALKMGAVDVLAKPRGEISTNIHIIKESIISKLKIISNSNLSAMKNIEVIEKENPVNRTKQMEHSDPINSIENRDQVKGIIMIGASTGGPRSIPILLQDLPEGLEWPIIIAQHMPGALPIQYIEHLGKLSSIPVSIAQNNEIIKNHHVYFAPGNKNIQIIKHQVSSGSKVSFKLSKEMEILDLAPNIDLLFQSATKIFQKDTIGVIMTGMGKDGTEGCKMIKEKGGKVIVQDKNSSIVFGMPKSAQKYADIILNLTEIGRKLKKMQDNNL